MPTKVHNIAVFIDCNQEQSEHWFELFKQIKYYLKSNIQFILWDSNLADIARSIVDVDTVHLMSRSIFKLNDYKLINQILQQYDIDKCIEIGSVPNLVSWRLKQVEGIQMIKVLDKLDTDYTSYSLAICSDNTPRVSYQQGIAYTPFPQINYKHFLDLDTVAVLEIKQDLGLLSYNNQIIHKSFVCGHIGLLSNELINYLEYNNCEWYDVCAQKGSFVLPTKFRYNLPIVYELLDCVIVSGPIDELVNYHILNAIASGTIVIAPRDDEYQALLGRGALYYSPTSSSELNACIEVIQKNDHKKTSIRELASEQFQRKYSYQAIAQFWSHLLSKI
ncbi:MAG: hypothetical protein RLZZ223_515 [Candidatus Parcubacteria bacterium]|jgi:glycosyltransferase involved in cell wall biosynthesis